MAIDEMAAVWALASTRHGVIAAAEVDELVGARRRRRMVERRLLVPVHPGVYRAAAAPLTATGRALAACLAGPAGSLASHASARWLWGLADGGRPERYEISFPVVRTGFHPDLRGVVVHETNVLPPHHTATVDGVPVTSVARTLLDVTRDRDLAAVRRLADRAIVRRIVTVGELRAVSDDLAGRGRRRSTLMRAVVESLDEATGQLDSEREAELLRVLVDAGLPRPIPQHPVSIRGRTYRIDLAYPEAMLAIEYDGQEHHVGVVALHTDRSRQNALVAAGWTVFRCTSETNLDTFVADVRAALRRAS